MAKNTKLAPGAPELAGETPALPSVTLEAVEPIRIGGIDVAPGETFEASPDCARALQDTGAAIGRD